MDGYTAKTMLPSACRIRFMIIRHCYDVRVRLHVLPSIHSIGVCAVDHERT